MVHRLSCAGLSLYIIPDFSRHNTTRVEAGENNSIGALRVVRDDRKETTAQVCNWTTLFLWDINTGTWPSRLEEAQMRQ
jgi:hypothetical protein